MALEKADLAAINKYVRDVVNRVPPRPIKAHTIGTLTVDDLVGKPNSPTPPSGDNSQRISTTEFVVAQVVGHSPKVTTSAISGGPPASPSDGDIWIATGVDSNGTRWQFQYNAGSASAYKWEFIGGPPIINTTPTGNGYIINAWNDIGWGYTTVRAGDYSVFAHVSGLNGTSAQTIELGIGVGSTTSVNRSLAFLTINASWDYTLAGWDRLNGVGAGVVLWVNGLANGAAAPAPGMTQFSITPIRIS